MEKKEETSTEEETQDLDAEEGAGTQGVGGVIQRYKGLLLSLVMAAVVCYAMIGFMGVPKDTYNTAVVALNSVITEVAALKAQVAGLQIPIDRTEALALIEGRVANLEVAEPLAIPDLTSYVFRTELADYATKDNLTTIIGTASDISTMLFNFETRIEGMELLLGELELMSESGEAVVTEESTLWSREIYTTYPLSAVHITYTVSPAKIEYEGDYIMMVYLTNYDLTAKSDLVVDVILSPKTGDRVKVDETELYLDSTRSPFYAWFAQIVKRTDGTCRRIVFSSEHMAIPAAQEVVIDGVTGIDPGRLTLRLELTIAYK